MVQVVGSKGFVDVDRPIIVVYGEGVVEVELGVEFRLISGKAERDGKAKGVGVMRRRRRIRGSSSGVFWVSSAFLFQTGSQTTSQTSF